MPSIVEKAVPSYPCPTCRNEERYVIRGTAFSDKNKTNKPLVVVRCAHCNYEEGVFYYTQEEDARSRYEEIEQVTLEKCVHCNGYGTKEHYEVGKLSPVEMECLMCQGKGKFVRYSEFFVRPHTEPPEEEQGNLTFSRPKAPWSF
jgi:Zn finger protein HypA/HybF involved in hydrogenase expression